MFGENLALGGSRAVGRLTRPGRDVWVMQEVLSLREYRLTVFDEGGKRLPLPASPVPAESLDREAQVLDLLYSLERTGKLEFPVKFPSRSSVPRKGYEKDFGKFALLMEKDPSLNFRVETYTDPDLKPAEQRTLLRERAAVLLGLLADNGADRKRLTTEAAAPGSTLSQGALSQGELPQSAPSRDAPPRGVVRLTLAESAGSGANR
jgi:hypothetical protein